MERVFNFSAGPATLPLEVLERARADIPDWQGSGMSVMEVSHRGKAFDAVAKKAEADVRDLMNVPDDYEVLFLQGGATMQFAMVPMNLAPNGGSADYLVTGSWSKKAAKFAGSLVDVNIASDHEDVGYNTVSPVGDWSLDPQAAYFHYTPNETIGGVEIHDVPDTGDVPVVADMSSTILSRPIPVDRFGLIYAGAQKNIGPAGICLVIARRDLVERAPSSMVPILTYREFAKSGSMTNTPPTFAWYLAGLVFQWLKAQGGLEVMAERNRGKADRLYGLIDGSDFYSNPVSPAFRSWMNVPFLLARPELDSAFLEQAEAEGLCNLKGHRSVGGMRASIYNAMPEEGVEALAQFMAEFERRNG
jgi:phosphoserine aminotransferase